jgi:hypothetical protein
VSLHRVERELREAIRRSSRPELEAGLERVGWTDDGSTLYVHIFARPEWRRVRPGAAFVLATADHVDLRTLADMRKLLEEARLYLHDETDRVLRWLDGR